MSLLPMLTSPIFYVTSHPQPPTAPTSHNFTKQRDKMRQKLEEKKKKRDHDSGKPGRGEERGLGGGGGGGRTSRERI